MAALDDINELIEQLELWNDNTDGDAGGEIVSVFVWPDEWTIQMGGERAAKKHQAEYGGKYAIVRIPGHNKRFDAEAEAMRVFRELGLRMLNPPRTHRRSTGGQHTRYIGDAAVRIEHYGNGEYEAEISLVRRGDDVVWEAPLKARPTTDPDDPNFIDRLAASAVALAITEGGVTAVHDATAWAVDGSGGYEVVRANPGAKKPGPYAGGRYRMKGTGSRVYVDLPDGSRLYGRIGGSRDDEGYVVPDDDHTEESWFPLDQIHLVAPQQNPAKKSKGTKHVYKVGDKVTRTTRGLTRDTSRLIITEVDVPGSDNSGRPKPAVRAMMPAFDEPGARGYPYLLEEIRPGWSEKNSGEDSALRAKLNKLLAESSVADEIATHVENGEFGKAERAARAHEDFFVDGYAGLKAALNHIKARSGRRQNPAGACPSCGCARHECECPKSNPVGAVLAAAKNPGRPQQRWKCSHCGTEGWYDPSMLHVVDPRADHDRPDGRACLASRKKKNPPHAELEQAARTGRMTPAVEKWAREYPKTWDSLKRRTR